MKHTTFLKAFVLALLAAMVLVAVAGAGNPPQETNFDYILYVSSAKGGEVDGINYADEDILKYVSATDTWSLFFDGTASGLPASADIDAYAIRFDPLSAYSYFSFDKPTNIPGLGTVDDSDVVQYVVSHGSGSWSLYFDGSFYSLDTNAEDIDAIAFYHVQYLAFSTSGNVKMNQLGGGTLSGADEDAFMVNLNGSLTFLIDGSHPSHGLGGNDLWGLAFDASHDSTYLALQKAATMNGYDFAAGDVIYQPPSSSAYLLWDASTHGFAQVDAIEVLVP